MRLISSKISQNTASSSIHLDIPKDSPLYAELQAYLSQKQKGDSFASIAKDDIDDIKSYEKIEDDRANYHPSSEILVSLVSKPRNFHGWWDNYMSIEAKGDVVNAIAGSEAVNNLGMALVRNTEDVVYTLVLTILEHFNGRFTNHRVMELPENGLEHWKAKFIDGLPPLFVERVKKTLRNPQRAIPYNTYTYGKLIGACAREGINLCNELKLSRHLKIDKLRESSQLGDLCTQFGLPDTATKCTRPKDSSGSNLEKLYQKRRSRRRSREERKEPKAHRKFNRFTKNRSRRELAKIKCYKCGKFGNIAPNYYDSESSLENAVDQPEFSGNNQPASIDACKCQGLTLLGLPKVEGKEITRVEGDDHPQDHRTNPRPTPRFCSEEI
ncbi:hypothetical protein MTR67_006793 [Solanum verrucosum]|uniref:Uncharacterized protein n=1 Tax=Solanum verrucosum TaxID=315347 RepID=A0AAF0PYI4_SOLVR|nr:hypothetical protein MTR67_006793 [Solanum verrucosum]